MSPQTTLLLSQLRNTVIKIGIANVTKQQGSADCGVYSIALVTDIANGRNPCFHI